MRFAYADPPYLGLCNRYGHDHGEDGRCWNDPETHRALIERLAGFDGWALSLTTTSLRTILPMCPDATRVMAWVKPFAIWKPGVLPAHAWEPVLMHGGRKRRWRHGGPATPRDWVAENITLRRGLTGAKPAGVVRWVLACLGATPDDEFVDLFPGSGAVTAAWEGWRAEALEPTGT